MHTLRDTHHTQNVPLPAYFSKSTHTNNSISVSTMPPSVK